jgi:hypothetical protein
MAVISLVFSGTQVCASVRRAVVACHCVCTHDHVRRSLPLDGAETSQLNFFSPVDAAHLSRAAFGIEDVLGLLLEGSVHVARSFCVHCRAT